MTVLFYTNVSRGVDLLHISLHTNYGGVPSYHFHLPITRQYYCRDCGRLTLTQQTGTRRQHPSAGRVEDNKEERARDRDIKSVRGVLGRPPSSPDMTSRKSTSKD